MSLDVRLARPEEYDAVGALTAAAYVDDGLAGGGYAEVLRDAAGRAAVAELLVAVEDEEVLGTVTLVSPDAPEEWRERTPGPSACSRPRSPLVAAARARRSPWRASNGRVRTAGGS